MLNINDLFSSTFIDSLANEASLQQYWHALRHYHVSDEPSLIEELKRQTADIAIDKRAAEWITELRSQPQTPFAINEIMARFGLDSDEGVVLLALAEALLRIPDSTTAQAFIQDKLGELDLIRFIPQQDAGWLEQSSFWGLAISQNLLAADTSSDSLLSNIWQKLGRNSLQAALEFAINKIGQQFVFAEEIHTALERRCDYHPQLSRFSFDMLGEAAICEADAEQYFQAYLEAIQAAGSSEQKDSSISIKLSALHPRLQNTQWQRLQQPLLNRLFQLLVLARDKDVAITIDAEESHRLELSLLIFENLLRSELCQGWGKLGLAVQAYSKRSLPVLAWLAALSAQTQTPIPVRLVKGAYWDFEIKYAQQQGLSGYPVFTQKAATDLSYLACAKFLLSAQSALLTPQFASHNVATVAAITQLASELSTERSNARVYEFQRLHGMGEAFYTVMQQHLAIPCRIYAPVGLQQTLLPYLVRRLLENGANSSFVFKLNDSTIAIDELLASPIEQLQPDSALPLPEQVFQPVRAAASGTSLDSLSDIESWQSYLAQNHHPAFSQPIIAGELSEGEALQQTFSPYKLDQSIGYRGLCSTAQIKQAISSAEAAFAPWQQVTVDARAEILCRYAQLLEKHKQSLVRLCVMEAGKCLQDALDEVREAIDFCYYYAEQAKQELVPQSLPAITGETNQLQYQGRGIFVCISPWNFPLAIFTGQIAAALVTGNTVLAKPASACTLIAYKAAELWHEAGLPAECLQFMPFASSIGEDALFSDSRIAGVAFTGSSHSAAQINLALAQRPFSAIATLIAETGGQNAMIVDSTALIEQVVNDAIRSAFNNAGQRCSALRVLYVPSEISNIVEAKLIGTMKTLEIGNPQVLSTDIGPVISKQAMDTLFEHIERQRVLNNLVYECPLDDHHNNGYFVPPTLIRLRSMEQLSNEVFGPVLHLISYEVDQIDRVVHEINRSGYGLTLGIHSRNQHFIEHISAAVDAGNIYINRDQIGASVAAQPFGGMGMSGTGPKAGGPNYLQQFIREKTLTQNTTASGGNLALYRELSATKTNETDEA